MSVSFLVNPYQYTAGWTPAEISTFAWYDASDSGSLSTSGSDVLSVTDKSGNGRTLSASATRPQTGVNTLNGLNVIDVVYPAFFNNYTTDWLMLTDGTTYVVGFVFYMNDLESGELQPLLHTRHSGSTQSGFQLIHLDAAPYDNIIYAQTKVSTNYSSSYGDVADDAWPGQEWACLSFKGDPDNGTAADRGRMYRNGVLIGTNSETTAAVSAQQHGLVIGSDTSSYDGVASTTSMRLAELVVLSGASATDENRVLLEGYLMSKWGL